MNIKGVGGQFPKLNPKLKVYRKNRSWNYITMFSSSCWINCRKLWRRSRRIKIEWISVQHCLTISLIINVESFPIFLWSTILIQCKIRFICICCCIHNIYTSLFSRIPNRQSGIPSCSASPCHFWSFWASFFPSSPKGPALSSPFPPFTVCCRLPLTLSLFSFLVLFF